MKIVHSRVTFDPIATVKIIKKQNRDILEFILAEFNVCLALPSLHAYLLAKKLSGSDVERELEEVSKILEIVSPSSEIVRKAVEIDAALVREGVLMKFDDLLIAASAIVTGAILVVDDGIERYKPLRKYGLEYISLGSFLDEVSAMAKDEAKKERIIL